MTPPTAPRGTNWAARRDANGWYVADSTDDEICRLPGRDSFSEGDAQYIARVANAHAPLVEALAGLIALVAAAFPTTGAAITAEARAALALARGEA